MPSEVFRVSRAHCVIPLLVPQSDTSSVLLPSCIRGDFRALKMCFYHEDAVDCDKDIRPLCVCLGPKGNAAYARISLSFLYVCMGVLPTCMPVHPVPA